MKKASGCKPGPTARNGGTIMTLSARSGSSKISTRAGRIGGGNGRDSSGRSHAERLRVVPTGAGLLWRIRTIRSTISPQEMIAATEKIVAHVSGRFSNSG